MDTSTFQKRYQAMLRSIAQAEPGETVQAWMGPDKEPKPTPNPTTGIAPPDQADSPPPTPTIPLEFQFRRPPNPRAFWEPANIADLLLPEELRRAPVQHYMDATTFRQEMSRPFWSRTTNKN